MCLSFLFLQTRLRGLELRSFVIDDQHFFESLVHHLIALPRSERPPLQVLRIQDYENEDISSFLCQSQKHMFFGAEAEPQRRKFRVFVTGNSDLEELAGEDSDEEETEEEETGTDSKEEDERSVKEGKGDGMTGSRSTFREDKRAAGGRRGVIKRGRSAFCCCKICRRTRTARRGRSLLFKKKEGGSQEVKNVERRRRREKQREPGTDVVEEVEKQIEEKTKKKEKQAKKSFDLETPPSPRVNPCPSPYPFDDCSSSPYLSSDFSLPPPMWDYEKPFFFYYASSCSPLSHCPPPPVSFLVIPRMMQRNIKCLLHHFPEINRIELSFPSKKFFPSQEHILDFLGPFAVFLEAFSFGLDPVHLQVVLRGCPTCCSQDEAVQESERQCSTVRRRGTEKRGEETSDKEGKKDRVRKEDEERSDNHRKEERKQGSKRQKKTRKALLPTKKQPSHRCYSCSRLSSLSQHRQQCLRRVLRDELSVFYVDEKDIDNRFKKFENDQFLLGYPSHQPPYFCLVCDEEQLNEEGNQPRTANDDGEDASQKRSAIYAQICSEYRESVRRREAIVEKHRKALKVNPWYRNFLACREQYSLSKEKTSSSGRRYVLLGFMLKEIVFLRKNAPSPTQPLSPSSEVAAVAQE